MGLYFIPLFTQRETYIECARSCCGAARVTALPLEGSWASTCRTNWNATRTTASSSSSSSWLSPACCCPASLRRPGSRRGRPRRLSYRTGGWVKVVSVVGVAFGTLVSAVTIVAMLKGS